MPTRGSPFPGEIEARRLVVGPDSVTWQFGSDVRLYLAPLYPLLLQVAHPTVAAGVRDYSDFDQRPWERLWRTLDYLIVLQYGGTEAVPMGHRLRELHKGFKGTKANGEPYYALERAAYAWVHATLLHTYVVAHRQFGRPMSSGQVQRFYREYIGLGHLVGVREDDLPPDWAGFQAYFERMVADELEHNETVERVLRAVLDPAAPEVPFLPEALWRVLRVPARRALYVGGVGLLSAELRARLRIRWTRRDESEFRALGAVSRGLTPLLPKKLQVFGPTHLRWRRRAIADGPLGPGGGIEHRPASEAA
jgi:uncharacterized protein (DUF2236 family)